MILAAGAWDLTMLDREGGKIIAAGVPVWVAPNGCSACSGPGSGGFPAAPQ